MTTLWHFTCDHGMRGIRRDGLLKPGPDGWVWLTDLRKPRRSEIGLTSHLLRCDRMAWRITVADPGADVVPWVSEGAPGLRSLLEASPVARPDHWWVSSTPVRITSLARVR